MKTTYILCFFFGMTATGKIRGTGKEISHGKRSPETHAKVADHENCL